MLEESQCLESQGVVHLSTGGVQAEKERGKVGKKKEKEEERKRGDGNKREGERVREGKKEAKQEQREGGKRKKRPVLADFSPNRVLS